MNSSYNFLEYHLPRYNELPDEEVYMDRLITILSKYLEPFEIPSDEKIITATMVNNYVKQKVIPAPVKKKYSKTHMIYLISIAINKTVLSINDTAIVIKRQMEEYPLEIAYDFFAEQLENALKVTFGSRDFAKANSEREKTELSKLVRSALLSFANKIYVKSILYKD